MLVEGSINVARNGPAGLRLRLAQIAVCAALFLCAAVGAADEFPTADPPVETTTATYALPSTGTLTAKDIGDGVWWQPVLNETSVTQVLTDMQAWGVKNLYLDVFRSGLTLFPSEVFPQREDAKGRDWLEYIITEAHKHDIRVHAWAQVLCWHESNRDAPTTHPMLVRHPAWVDVSSDGFAVDGKTTSRYVSPAVPEVHDALAALAREIAFYPVDGINLDAVEYNNYGDFGYNAQAISEFESEFEAHPFDLRKDMDNESDWMKWVAFREDKLTSIVQVMAHQVRNSEEHYGRRIMLSACVHPGYGDTRGINRRYQNWKSWLDMKLVDATVPKCFSSDLPELEQQLWEARSEHMGSKVACVPGLQVDSGEMDVHPSLIEQKRLLRNAGFQHCTVMDYAGLKRAMENPEAEPEDKGGFWDFFTRD